MKKTMTKMQRGGAKRGKGLLPILLIALLVLSLTACNSAAAPEATPAPRPTEPAAADTQSGQTAPEGYSRPADVTYTLFTIGGVEFSIPSYFKWVENSSAGNAVFEVYGNGALLARLIFNGEDVTFTQKEFDENKDALTNAIIESYGTARLLEANDTTLAGLSARSLSCLVINNENVTVGVYDTFAYNPSGSKSVRVQLALFGQSPAFLTEDYNQILATAVLTEPAEPEATPAPSAGLRPEFKQAMDAYEAFYRDYCDLLKKYGENPSDLTLLQEYMSMMTKVQEMDAAFEEWDQDEMNNEELKYYLEVQTRVLQMLADVNG